MVPNNQIGIQLTARGKEAMTDLTTKTAQSLHAEWCRQMRKKGFHGPAEACTESWLSGEVSTRSAREDCKSGFDRCRRFHADLIPWPDLPDSRRQEYLSTAKAVLPEIVEAIFDECQMVAQDYEILEVDDIELKYGVGHCPIAIRQLRDRRLKELE